MVTIRMLGRREQRAESRGQRAEGREQSNVSS
jgi:hypothetical protein